jgi:hypothetical protein
MKYEKIYKNTTTGLLAASLLTGCSTETFQPNETETVKHEVACNPATLTALSDIALAQSCAAEYRNSSIALVNYSLDAPAAERIASDLEQDISRVTEGIVSVDVTVVSPTEQARQAFDHANSARDCVSATSLEFFGTYAADKAMPELAQYDKIIAESDEKSCVEGVHAVTDIAQGRYVEMFDSLTDDNERSVKPEQRFTALHETLHLYGLKHAGTLFDQGLGLGDYARQIEQDARYSINLNEYIENSQYKEYGDTFSCNVMSNDCVQPNPDENRQLNTIQRNQLLLPERLANPDTTTLERIVEAETIRFDAATPQDTFATLRINEDVHLSNLKDDDPLSNTMTNFNNLHFIPIIKNTADNQSVISDVEVYLSGSGTIDQKIMSGLDTVALGQLSLAEGTDETTYDVTIDDQVVSITFGNGGVSITLQ